MSVGDALAEARSRAGLTVAQVSQRTCIRETIIRGIERGDFSACGGDFYARGHIRSIGRAIGIDPEDLVREYDATHGTPQPITAADIFEPATPIRLKERRSPNWSVAMVVVLALIIGFGVYRLVSSGSPTHPVAGRPAPSAPVAHHPSPSPTPSPSATPASHAVVVRLTALEDCWVGFSRHGTPLSQAYVVGGTTRTWHFKHRITMQIGNPGGILLTVNGKKLGRPGAAGQAPLSLSLGPGQRIRTTTAG